jgi:hypothetical protein
MFPDPTVQHVFPLQASYYRQPLPLVSGSPVSEYYELIRPPVIRQSSSMVDWSDLPQYARLKLRGCVLTVASGRFSVTRKSRLTLRRLQCLPSSSAFLYIHARFSDPDRPSESRHFDSYVVASVTLTTSPSAFSSVSRLNVLKEGVAFLPAYMFPCVRFVTIVRSNS